MIANKSTNLHRLLINSIHKDPLYHRGRHWKIKLNWLNSKPSIVTSYQHRIEVNWQKILQWQRKHNTLRSVIIGLKVVLVFSDQGSDQLRGRNFDAGQMDQTLSTKKQWWWRWWMATTTITIKIRMTMTISLFVYHIKISKNENF